MWIDLLLIYLLVELTEATSDGERRLNTKLINFLKSSLYIEKRFRRDLLSQVNGKGNIVFEDNCHPSIPLVSCEKNYCDFASCPNFPNAECHLNLCGKCEPVYYFEGNKVDCYDFQTNSPPHISPKTNEIKFDDNCTSDVPLVTCSNNPCKAHKCNSYPNAECHVNLCGTCEANFYVNGQQVLCNTTQTNDQLSQCFKERQRIIENKNLNKFVVDCDLNGAYKPLQCWPFVGLCWCVNKNGEEMFGTRSYFPNKPNCEILLEDCRSKEYGCCPDNKTAAQGFHHQGCSNVIKSCQVSLFGCCDDQITFAKGPNQKGCSRLVSKCEHLRSIAQQIFSFQPQCDKQGHFNPIQCWDTLDQCWCVNKDGIELKGTRLKGKQPDCSAVACEDKSNDCHRFAIVPGFCFRLKRYMTEYCRKSCGFCKEVSVVKHEPVRRGCSSPFGCCSDYISPAKGPDSYMCPLYSSVCSMPKVVGECYGYFPRYFYNQETNTCELFVYGGCRGNGNNFADLNECEEKCLEELTPTKVSTTQLAELGIDMNVKETNKIITSDDFNVLAGPLIECANKFGCCEDGITPALGNDFQGCPRYMSFCEMPPASGSCTDNTIKYFYNPEKMLCEDFFYGGCGGNANNFESVELCMNECNNKMIELKKQNVALNTHQIATTIQTTNDQTAFTGQTFLTEETSDDLSSKKYIHTELTLSNHNEMTINNDLFSTVDPVASSEEIISSVPSKNYGSTNKLIELSVSSTNEVNYIRGSANIVTESSSSLPNDLTANDVLSSTIEPLATTEVATFSVLPKGYDSTNGVIELSMYSTDEVNSIKDSTEKVTESRSSLPNDLTADDVLSSTNEPIATTEKVAFSVSSKGYDSTDKVTELSLTDKVNSIKNSTEIVTESSSLLPNDLTANDVLSSTIEPIATTEKVAFSVSSKRYDSTDKVMELSMSSTDEVNSIKDSTEIVTESSSSLPNHLTANDVLSSTIEPIATTEKIAFSVSSKGYGSTDKMIGLALTDEVNSIKESTEIVTELSSLLPNDLTVNDVLSSTIEPMATTKEVVFSVSSKGYDLTIGEIELSMSSTDEVNSIKDSADIITESRSSLPNDLTTNDVLSSTIEPMATTKEVAFSVSSKEYISTDMVTELSLTDKVNSLKDSTEIVTESSSLLPKDLTANDVLSSTIEPIATTEKVAFSVSSNGYDPIDKVMELSMSSTDEVNSIKDSTEIVTESSSLLRNDLTPNDILSSTIEPISTTEEVAVSVSSKGYDSTNGVIELSMSSTDEVNSIKDSANIVTESSSSLPNDLTTIDVLSSTIDPLATTEEIAFSVSSTGYDSTDKVIELSLTDEVKSIKDSADIVTELGSSLPNDLTEIVTESSSLLPKDLTANDVLSSTIEPIATTEHVAFSVLSKGYNSTNKVMKLSMSSTDEVNTIKDSTEIVTESSSLLRSDSTVNNILFSTIEPITITEEIALSVSSTGYDSTDKVIELSLTDEVNSIKESTEIVTELSSSLPNDLTANDVLSSTIKPLLSIKEVALSVSSKECDSTDKANELSLTDKVNSIKDSTEIVTESSSSLPNDLIGNDVLSSTIEPLATTEVVAFSVLSKGYDSTNGVIELSMSLTDEINSIKHFAEIVTEPSSLLPNDLTANDALYSTIEPVATTEEIALSVSSTGYDSTDKVIELSLTDEVKPMKVSTDIVTESSSSLPNDLTVNDVLSSTFEPMATTKEVAFSVSSIEYVSTDMVTEFSLTDKVNSIIDSTEIVTESSSLMPKDLTVNDVLSSTIEPIATTEQVAFSVSSKGYDSTDKVIELSMSSTDEVNSMKDSRDIVTESSSSLPNDLTVNNVLSSTIEPKAITEEVAVSVSSKGYDSAIGVIEFSMSSTDEVSFIKESTEIVTESSSSLPNNLIGNDFLSSTIEPLATTEVVALSVSPKGYDSTNGVIELSMSSTDEVKSMKDAADIVTESSSSLPNDLTVNNVLPSTIEPLAATEEIAFSVSSKGFDSTDKVTELSFTDEVNLIKVSTEIVTESSSSLPNNLIGNDVLSSTIEPLATAEVVAFSVSPKGYDSTNEVIELSMSSTDEVNSMKDSANIVTESSSSLPNDLTTIDVLSSTINPLATTEEIAFSVSSTGYDSADKVIELSFTDEVNFIKVSTEIVAESSSLLPNVSTGNNVLSSTIEPIATTEKVAFSVSSNGYDPIDKVMELSMSSTDEVNSIKDSTEIVTESSSLLRNDLTPNDILSSTIEPISTTEEVAVSVSSKGYDSTNGVIELSMSSTDEVNSIKDSANIVTESSSSLPNDLTTIDVLSSTIDPLATTEEIAFSVSSTGYDSADKVIELSFTDEVNFIKVSTEIVAESSSLLPNVSTGNNVLSSTIEPIATTEEIAFSVLSKGFDSTNKLSEFALTDEVNSIKESTEIVTESSSSLPNDLTVNDVSSSIIEPLVSTEKVVFSETSGSVSENIEFFMPSTDNVSTTEDSLASLFKKSSSSLNKLNSLLSSSQVAAISTTVSTLSSKRFFGGIIKSDKNNDDGNGFLSGSEISEIHNDILNTYNLTSSLQHSESTTNSPKVKSDNFKSIVEDIIQPTTPSSLDSSISLSHVCKLPFNKGQCTMLSPRYYYNSLLNQCLLFVYGGCGGNGNNFKTENECSMKCSNKSLIRENDLNTNKKCGSLYGCCLDNINGARGPNFLGCPKYNSSCDYPPAYGPCRANLARWFYDGRKKECNTFSWGGCEGNENSFETEVDCLLQCGDDKQEYTDIFDESLETVLYPGCESDYGCCSDGLNKAKGPNQEGCPVYASECDMPNVPGNGNERLIRYIYDGLKRKCNAFVYSGKGGNLNNFVSITECEKKCEKSCEDSLPSYCAEWKNLNFCTDRPTIMNEYCKKTCNMCT